LAAQLTTVISFNGSNGGSPNAGLIADANGNLFGTTQAGGTWGDGTVFEIQNTGTLAAPVYASTPSTLVSFDGSNGQAPAAAVIIDGNGDLFGTTEMGGVNNIGTVFEIKNIGTLASPVYASTPTAQINFSYPDSSGTPNAALIVDANGNLFGTNGSVFEIQNTGPAVAPVFASTPTTLLNGNGFNLASYVSISPGLIADANGDLFGTTSGMGNGFPYDTVFELQNTGSVAAPVYASAPITLVGFNDSNGAVHPGGLVADANGNLFGTTQLGGAWGDGMVFEIKNTGTLSAPVYANGMKTLVSFNGSTPAAGLIVDANGNLFGTTGHDAGFGTVFEIRNTGALAAPVYASSPTTLISFNGSDGEHPNATLIADASGNLFGTTESSLSGQGTVFEITGAGFMVEVSPTIVGTVGGQTTTNEAPVTPFKSVTIRDANASATDTLTITLGGVGGTLSGAGLSGGTGGVYAMSGTVAAITSELDALVFTPKAGAPNTSSTTTFALTDLSSGGGAPAVDSTTSVIDTDGAVAPTIAGTVSGQTAIREAPVTPFKGVTIGDTNAGATDTLTITLGGAGGTLSGAGLSGGAGGVYALSGTAVTITAELDALVFTPIFTQKAGAPSTSSTTTFTLSDLSSAGGQPAVDTTTTVIDKTATLIIETRPHALVDARHHPPGQPSPTNGPDVIIALGAYDTIKGLGGNDSLVGGAPGVVLFGGPGADHFIFETLRASPPRHPDTIMDFNHRQSDKIDLYSLRDFVPGNEPIAFIGSQTFAQFHHNHHGVFGMVRYAGGEVQVNFDHHLTTEFEIVMHGTPALHAGDFIL
jgi:hypothetical protein